MSRVQEKLERRLNEFLDGLVNQSMTAPLPLLPLPEEVRPETWKVFVSYKRLMHLVRMLSHYRAKGEFTETGNMLDEYAVTEDEEDVIRYAIESGMNDAWLKVARMSKQVKAAFSFDAAVERWEMEFEGMENYDPNVFAVLQRSVEDFVVWKTLLEWWKVKGYDRGVQMAMSGYGEAEERLLECVHWRKQCIRRPGSVF